MISSLGMPRRNRRAPVETRDLQRDVQDRAADFRLRWEGPIELVTGQDGAPHSVLRVACQGLGEVRAWFRADGRLMRAEFPRSPLDVRLAVRPPMDLYEASLAAEAPDADLLARALEGVASRAVAEHLADLQRKASRPNRGRPRRDRAVAFVEAWVVYLEVLRQMAGGASRKAACRTVSRWHEDVSQVKFDKKPVIPPLSEYGKFVRFNYCCED